MENQGKDAVGLGSEMGGVRASARGPKAVGRGTDLPLRLPPHPAPFWEPALGFAQGCLQWGEGCPHRGAGVAPLVSEAPHLPGS